MEEDEYDNNSEIGKLIDHINKLCKKPQIDEQLSHALDKFHQKTTSQDLYLKNGIFNINFAEAALFLQSCSQLYGKKVDLFWEQTLEFHTRLIENECRDAQEKGKPVDTDVIKQLEERRNRYKRKKKFKLILEEASGSTEDFLFESESTPEEKQSENGEKKLTLFEPDYEMNRKWRQINNEADEYIRIPLAIRNQQRKTYRLKNHLILKSEDFDIIDPDDNEFNTKYSRVPGGYFIDQIFEYNDQGLLPDFNNCIATMRLCSYLRVQFMIDNEIPFNAPFSSYKDKYLIFRKKFFESEAKRWQNMPLETMADLHRQLQYLAQKEREENALKHKSKPFIWNIPPFLHNNKKCDIDGCSECSEDTKSSIITITDSIDKDFDTSFVKDDVAKEELSSDKLTENTFQENTNSDKHEEDIVESDATAQKTADGTNSNEDTIDGTKNQDSTVTPYESVDDGSKNNEETSAEDTPDGTQSKDTDVSTNNEETSAEVTTDGTQSKDSSMNTDGSTNNGETSSEVTRDVTPEVTPDVTQSKDSSMNTDGSTNNEETSAEVTPDVTQSKDSSMNTDGSTNNEETSAEVTPDGTQSKDSSMNPNDSVGDGTKNNDSNVTPDDSGVVEVNYSANGTNNTVSVDDGSKTFTSHILIQKGNLLDDLDDIRSVISDHSYCKDLDDDDDDTRSIISEHDYSKVALKLKDVKLMKKKSTDLMVPMSNICRIIPNTKKIMGPPPVKIRKLSKKQIDKLMKSKVVPVKELKFDKFYSRNYQTQIGEGDIQEVDYESSEEATPEEILAEDNDDTRSIISEHNYSQNSQIELPCDIPEAPADDSGFFSENNTRVPDLDDSESVDVSEFSQTVPVQPPKKRIKGVDPENEEEYLRLLEKFEKARLERCKELNIDPEQSEKERRQRKLEEQQSKERVQKWKEHITPILKNLKENDFDIHEYGTKIMEDMEVEETKPFKNIVNGKSSAEVVRYFIASLQLANTMNVEICGVKQGELSNDTCGIKLLKKERYHEYLSEYHAPSEETFRNRLKRMREMQKDELQNSPEEEPPQPKYQKTTSRIIRIKSPTNTNKKRTHDPDFLPNQNTKKRIKYNISKPRNSQIHQNPPISQNPSISQNPPIPQNPSENFPEEIQNFDLPSTSGISSELPEDIEEFIQEFTSAQERSMGSSSTPLVNRVYRAKNNITVRQNFNF